MNLKKLRKIKRELEAIKKSPSGRTFKELTSIANQLELKRESRGKEPTFEKLDPPPFLTPITIPGHAGDLAVGTVKSIVFWLLNAHDTWEIYLMSLEKDV